MQRDLSQGTTSHIAADAHAWLLGQRSRWYGAGAIEEAEVFDLALDHIQRTSPLLDRALAMVASREAVDRLFGLGPLEDLLGDSSITEIMVNGPHRVWIERDGNLRALDLHLRREDIEAIVERIVGPLGLRADRAEPIVDARLPDGSRVNITLPPAAVDGPCLTIRRFRASGVGIDGFGPAAVQEVLAWAIAHRLNMIISGGTGSGKTSLVNALVGGFPHDRRIITIEDAAELQLPGRHVVRMEASGGNADGVGGTSIRALVRNALRMRPDLLVIGEVRGPEALDMLQAMNTGHEGSMSTCHANTPADALRRIETMIVLDEARLPLDAVREQMHASLDLVVHVERGPDGSRRVAEISEVSEAVDAPCRVRSLVRNGQVVGRPQRRSRSTSTMTFPNLCNAAVGNPPASEELAERP